MYKTVYKGQTQCIEAPTQGGVWEDYRNLVLPLQSAVQGGWFEPRTYWHKWGGPHHCTKACPLYKTVYIPLYSFQWLVGLECLQSVPPLFFFGCKTYKSQPFWDFGLQLPVSNKALQKIFSLYANLIFVR